MFNYSDLTKEQQLNICVYEINDLIAFPDIRKSISAETRNTIRITKTSSAKEFYNQMLFIASELGMKDEAEIYLRKGADVNATTIYMSTPRMLAFKNGHQDIVDLIDKFKTESKKGH